MRHATLLAALTLAGFGYPPAHADVTVYDDTLAAGWENWSYFGTIAVDFDNPAPVHAGTASIAVTFNEPFAALSLRTTPVVDATTLAALHFWVYGGVGGTNLAVFTQPTDGGNASDIHTESAAAGVWTEVVVPMSALGNPATIARINVQDNGNGNLAATFFVDDLKLVAANQPPAPIFADGFENGTTSLWCTHLGCAPPPTLDPIVITSGSTTVNGVGLPSRAVAWSDGGGEPREAVMIDQRPGGAGYLRRYTYRANGLDRVCTGVAANGGAIQGFGYVTNHLGDPVDFGGAWGNWSVGVAGTTSVVLAGAHHVILQYSMPAYPLGGRTIPTTVQWFFATGRSHPIWSVTQDARAHPQGNLGGDSRSPYGEMAFAGDTNNGVRIAGVSWGDTYKFVSVANDTTNESTLLEGSSGWRYNQANTVPYVLAWTETVDAEQGTVATSSIQVQDHGSDARVYPATGFGKNQQDLNGPIPLEDDWAYQLMNYPYPPQGGTNNKKMAWGTNSGALGGFDNYGCGGCNLQEYSRHRDSTTPFTGGRENGLLLAYSTFVVFGSHSGGYTAGATGQVVQQVESSQLATLSASTGTVRTSGPRGIPPGHDVNVDYVPDGYNHVYATWDLEANGNAVAGTLTPTNGYPLIHPILVVHNYNLADLPNVTLGGQPATNGLDYAATVDNAGDRLWLTILRDVSSALEFAVTP